MKRRIFAIFVLAVGSCLAISAGWAENRAHLMVSPSDLKWTDVASMAPGAKIAVIEGPLNKAVPFTFRLKLPANYKIAPHWHPAVERVTVITGTLYFAAGDKFDSAKAKPLGPGSVAIMPAKSTMFGYTEEETIIQVHGVGPWGLHYVDSADDPRKK
jgi:hypothetical protein